MTWIVAGMVNFSPIIFTFSLDGAAYCCKFIAGNVVVVGNAPWIKPSNGEGSVALSDWTNLAIAGACGLGAAALILHKLSGPVTLTGKWQRLGDFAVFDALFTFGLKRSAKRQKLELKIYTTLRRSPLERDDGQRSGRSAGNAAPTLLDGASGRQRQEAAISRADFT